MIIFSENDDGDDGDWNDEDSGHEKDGNDDLKYCEHDLHDDWWYDKYIYICNHVTDDDEDLKCCW